jgi:hypothetical protein
MGDGQPRAYILYMDIIYVWYIYIYIYIYLLNPMHVPGSGICIISAKCISFMMELRPLPISDSEMDKSVHRQQAPMGEAMLLRMRHGKRELISVRRTTAPNLINSNHLRVSY